MGKPGNERPLRFYLVLCMGLSSCANETTSHDLDGSSLQDGAADGDGSPRLDGARDDAALEGITGFVFRAANNHGLTADVDGVVHGTNIALTVPNGTSVTALVPTITYTGIRLAPASDTAESFAHPVEYTVTGEAGGTVTYTATVTVAPDCTPMPPTCDHSVYDRARQFATDHPTRTNGTSWDGYCAALAWEFSDRSHAAQPSAIAAYHASHILGTDPSAAPVGAYHYWSYLQYGHVGTDLLGGGRTVFMASAHLATAWNPAIGINSVAGYNADVPAARYLGWSLDYAGSHVTGGGGAACTNGSPLPAGCLPPATTTVTTGVPDGIFWMLMQEYAAANGYTGPIDGTMTVAAWAGVQQGFRAYGYTGPVNGVPGMFTYEAFQRVAATYGYTGPVNGILGVNSYRGFAAFLNAHYAAP